MRIIFRKFPVEPFTRDALRNVAALLSNIANRLFTQTTTVPVSHLAMAEIRKRQAAAAIVILNHYKKIKKRRRWWVRPWLARRNVMGAYNNLMQEITVEDPNNFESLHG